MTKPNQTQLTFLELPYSPDALLSYFAAIEQQPWAMLLHSAAQSHPNSRFDIMVGDPIATLCSDGSKNIIRHANGDIFENNKDPFDSLNILQQQLLPPHPSTTPWPFLGGAMGYFSYDLARCLETLPKRDEHDIELFDMAVGIYDWALIADHKLQKLMLIEPKNAERFNWLTQQLARCKNQSQEDFLRTSDWQSNMTLEQYGEKFAQVQSYLLAGDCYQINLAQRFKARYQGSEWQAYQNLSKQNGAPFSGFLRLDDGAILSLSPERFLQLQDKEIETKPIKGTFARHKDPKRDEQNKLALLHNEKDRSENLMIVDLLRNDIGKVAQTGSVAVPVLFNVETFPAVHHLVSKIVGKLSLEKSPTDLLRACFPGGSITGAPKVRAMQIIEQLEPNRRHIYCGSLAYLSRCGTMDSNIAIRTLLCHKEHIYAWAGGGLVADSQMNAEYQETLDKLSKILPIL